MVKTSAYIFLFCLIFGAQLRASCCSSSSAGGVGRLLRHERAMVEMSMSTRYVYGRFNSESSFSGGHIGHLPHVIIEPEIQMVTRLFWFFEPFLRLPARIQTSDVRTGANISDITFGARQPIIKENFFTHAPAIFLLESVRIPTGSAIKHDSTLEAEDITSTGHPLITLGILLEKDIKRITYGLSYNFSLEPHHRRDQWHFDTFIHAPSFSTGFYAHDKGFLSFSLSPTFHYVSGLGLHQRKVGVAASYAQTLHSHIKLNSTIGVDVPISYLGKNSNSEFFVRLGLRFGVF